MNKIDFDKLTLRKYTEKLLKSAYKFDCGNSDLNEFFKKDAFLFETQLFGKTYCFLLRSNKRQIVSIFTISNDSVKIRAQLPENSVKLLRKNIPQEKQSLKNYPAVLIGRLGVDKKYLRTGIGSQILDFIKSWFRKENNKTGCRFLIVDAYNTEEVTSFYRKNGFSFLFDDEKTEMKFIGLNVKLIDHLHTRMMIYDLIEIREG